MAKPHYTIIATKAGYSHATSHGHYFDYDRAREEKDKLERMRPDLTFYLRSIRPATREGLAIWP